MPAGRTVMQSFLQHHRKARLGLDHAGADAHEVLNSFHALSHSNTVTRFRVQNKFAYSLVALHQTLRGSQPMAPASLSCADRLRIAERWFTRTI